MSSLHALNYQKQPIADGRRISTIVFAGEGNYDDKKTVEKRSQGRQLTSVAGIPGRNSWGLTASSNKHLW